ncbi:MAG TPA: PadR family transcriptional regulator [Actinomycetota bacterium]
MLELAVLGLLKERPMYGYELKKQLDERLGHAWRISYGSLYPTLKKLAKSEAVEMEYPKGETSRRKNVYRLAQKGEELFEQLLEEQGPQAAEDREAFMLRLAFFRYTKPETRRRLLERRRGYLVEQLARIKDRLKNLKERMDAYSLELMRHGELEMEHDIRWLDSIIASEKRAEKKTKTRRVAKKPMPTRPAGGAG